jgi:hypothetical protein
VPPLFRTESCAFRLKLIEKRVKKAQTLGNALIMVLNTFILVFFIFILNTLAQIKFSEITMKKSVKNLSNWCLIFGYKMYFCGPKRTASEVLASSWNKKIKK